VADGMLWPMELRPHTAGEFSMADTLANLAMEEQVLAFPDVALVGVYDNHGGLDTSCFLRSSLFPHIQYYSAFLHYVLPNFSSCSC
jgi:pyruvate dehydrogenase phosphatase